jgi:hypothetical protein
VRRGVAATTKGRWPGLVKGGATVNATVDERDSDMGGAVYHDNRVEIARVRNSCRKTPLALKLSARQNSVKLREVAAHLST